MSLFTLFKRKKKQVMKKSISIQQTEDTFILEGKFGEKFKVVELWLFLRGTDEGVLISSQQPNNHFLFKVGLDEIYKKVNSAESLIYDWYFKIVKDYDEHTLGKSFSKSEKVEEFIRCGRFQETNVENLEFYQKGSDSYFINYLTIKGSLSLSVNQEPSSRIQNQIDRVKRVNNNIQIEGKLFTRNSVIKSINVLVRARNSELEMRSSEVDLNPLLEEKKNKYGLNRYEYRTSLDFLRLNSNKLIEEDIYDLFFELEVHDSSEKRLIRIGRPTYRARLQLKELYKVKDGEAVIINPYYTFKLENLSFEVYRYKKSSFKYLRRLKRLSWLTRIMNKHRDVWLVGERTYKAQDTGYHFFKYMRENHPNKEVYYVIEADSPERKNVEPLGNVLIYKSKEHIKKTIIAKKVISSHHPDYLYPIRTERFKRKIKALKVFLQHGVMGTKNMVANYGKQARSFDTDVFLVSSDFERDMIINDFGYEPEEVYVTGLSRFDNLFKKDVKLKNQVLIIPTWRDWIITEEDFLQSEYFERYRGLINNEQLHELSKRHQFEIVFCLHPNMQRFTEYFRHDKVKIINQGEIDVQRLIKESKLMITDYSSVGFDFSFLHKPIIYYQFDRERFIGSRPSHLDLDNDLPGEIVFKEEKIIDLIKKYSERNFKMKEEYKIRANKFVKYRDQSASKRIYEVVKNHKIKEKLIEHPRISLILEGLYNRFRRSKHYFPIMKRFYNIGRRIIPVDQKLILFESGIGKQYGDSPKVIYEELINQGLDYKVIWVYNKQHRFAHDKTKRIKRLSPQYYYYLLRAKYWVNNQNFPTYIEKRPETIYLQTWHGTPLKKMLYDIENVQGRSQDYVKRVGNAIKNWDYLVSPSEYATNAFRSAFKYEGKILEVGYPRNDIFYLEKKEEIKRLTLNRLHLPRDKKVILYAPTFRDNKTTKRNHFIFQQQLDLQKMKEKLGDDYVVLLRMHVVIKNKIKIDKELSGFVYDVSNYPDVQDLLLITDILITDYSSIMFDFANTRKPMLFFTYDLEEYRDDIRGFYMDFEREAPGPLLFNTDEIIENIEEIEEVRNRYEEKYNRFYEKYCPLEDGRSAERIIEEVFRKENN